MEIIFDAKFMILTVLTIFKIFSKYSQIWVIWINQHQIIRSYIVWCFIADFLIFTYHSREGNIWIE